MKEYSERNLEKRAESPTRVLVTGAAGFIGFHISRRLLGEGHEVLGVDNFSQYYDVRLKRARIRELAECRGFELVDCSLEDRQRLAENWKRFSPDTVIHLAAQAGVRYSLDNPDSFVSSNIVGTYNLLELCREHSVLHLLAASTSSIYGSSPVIPFEEGSPIASPLSLYAATKGATELLGHSYSAMYGIPMTFFRFFTVYGPWGRPDMAAFKFTRAILAGEPIEIYNDGNMMRDFTYIDDLSESVSRLIKLPPVKGSPVTQKDSLSLAAPFRVVNIGKGSPDRLMDFIDQVERAVGRTAIRKFLPMQTGEMFATFADVNLLGALTGYRPSTSLSVGIPRFVNWYREYHGV
jgi:UDP-glucuronate 4-epimerase